MRKLCVCASPAHVVEPKYPGVAETLVNLGDCWDARLLEQNGGAIINLCKKNAECHRRSQRFLAAAGALLTENMRAASSCVDEIKLEEYAYRLSKRLFGTRQGSGVKEASRYLSGITPDGLIYYENTLSFYAEEVQLIRDEYGAVARLLLGYLRDAALHAGQTVITCWCPMFPYEKIDALILPELSLAFACCNSWHEVDAKGRRSIHARRFLDADALARHRQRLHFTRKAARELVSESVKALADAKKTHDILESAYMQAMDYEKATHMGDAVIKAILARADDRGL